MNGHQGLDWAFIATYGLLLLVLVWALSWVISVYNSLVRLKHGVSQAWSNIDVILVQRHDELPKLVEACKQYMKHEQTTLERVTVARQAVQSAVRNENIAALGQAESSLRSSLINLMSVVEQYPELKADQSFCALQSRIHDLENAIADRREFYNEAVNLSNVRIQQFPDNLVAKLTGFTQQPLLNFTETEKSDPNLKALFNS